MRKYLDEYCVFPPTGTGIQRTPLLSMELEMLVNALRDSEVLVQGNVPAAFVRDRYEIV